MGAGPAGATLSLLLTQQGVGVTLIEAGTGFRRPLRGEALMPSGLACLERMDLAPLVAGLPRRELRGWSFYVDGQHLFTAEEPLGSSFPCTLIEQECFLEALVAEARRHAGFRLLRGTRVSELLMDRGRAAGVVLADGRREPADLVIGCDGRQSLVRRKSGVPLRSSPSPIDLLWFRLQEPFSSPSGSGALSRWLADRFVTVLGPEGSFALFRTATGGLQLGWVMAAGEVPERSCDRWRRCWSANSPEPLRRWLMDTVNLRVEKPVRLSVEVGTAMNWHRPGVLLLGDAAHPMSPIRAQGINMALRDAEAAADLLKTVLANPEKAAIDTAIAGVARRRLPEIVAIQQLQRREAERGERLRGSSSLRRLVASSPEWIRSWLAHRWIRQQRILREGLPKNQGGWP